MSAGLQVFEALDAGIGLNEAEAMVLESVQALARDRIAPRAAELDRTGLFPRDSMNDINALGLNGMFIPESHGGAALSYRAYLACLREIAASCAATGITWATNFHAALPILDGASDPLKARLLPRLASGAIAAIALTEPDAGSDATAMRMSFTPDGDGILVNGVKQFITNGGEADLYVLFGKWDGIADPRAAVSVLVLEAPTPGFRVVRTEDKMGHRGSATAALAFDGCRVPRANLIGEPGSGLATMHRFLNKSRPSVAAHALGIARAAFMDAVSYVNERRQFGRRVGEFQGIQFLLADLATDLALCERWLWHVAARVEAGATDLAVEASMLKLRASDLAMRIADQSVQLHGGYGYCRDLRVERLMRDAKVTQIWEGTNQIHRQAIGRSLLRRNAR